MIALSRCCSDIIVPARGNTSAITKIDVLPREHDPLLLPSKLSVPRTVRACTSDKLISFGQTRVPERWNYVGNMTGRESEGRMEMELASASRLNEPRKTEFEFDEYYSPRCVAITSCSARGSCSRAGCNRSLEYVSWKQTSDSIRSGRSAASTFARKTPSSFSSSFLCARARETRP